MTLITNSLKMKLDIENGLYKSIFDNAFDGLACCQMVFDAKENPIDYIHLKVNKNFEKLTGLKNVEGKKITNVIPGIVTSNPELFYIYGQVSLTGKPQRFETYIKQLKRWFLISVYSQKKGFFVVVLQNTTQQRLIKNYLEDVQKATANLLEDLCIEKDNLKRSMAKDEAILASICDGLVAFDINRKVMIINQVAQTMLEWDTKFFEDQKFDTLPFVDEVGQSLSLKKQMLDITNRTDNLGISSFYYLVRQDKIKISVMLHITPIKINNEIIGVVLVIRDVTHEKELDRIKSEFLSLASHQLRTPLGICKWYAEAILEDAIFKTLSKTTQNYLREIYKNNGRLITLVSDLLSVARIDQNKIENNPELINVTKTVRKTIKGIRILAKKYKIVLHLEIKTANIPDTYIDPIKIQEVLENLLSNAINYSNKSGSINVVIDYKNDQISIAIIDTGIGMGVDDQKNIFTKFYRSKIAASKNTEGTGLGLYVAKSYVTDWGGQIKVKSSLGKGSTFLVTIPIIKENMKKILIIEDEIAYSKLLSDKLIKKGYQVVSTTDGKKGLKKATTEKPDLILLDILMPIMDGVAVLNKLHQKGLDKKTKIIMLTNYEPDEKTLGEIMKCMPNNYFVKSDIKLNDLMKKINAVLS